MYRFTYTDNRNGECFYFSRVPKFLGSSRNLEEAMDLLTERLKEESGHVELIIGSAYGNMTVPEKKAEPLRDLVDYHNLNIR